mmetsp:Transcript_13302/g.18172  ORF Transcript_13302/g.18172 Transcript_13302/m.18172 type:complete len:142 (+) Transcript_13302:328-753(+)|eukprot:CAMPEP_0196580312 /NCGR_PEP_ID=MMETSP1081-20130531/28450_1 /TAXON_ID=36882 /ORGANISM="Pyramimonas amylifera, Strain CCMP720" /LENGTH=141 /DNA_ID=CAMNT_0041900151 /DNA_START=324 /DNA_END=749 /DNA_ORIENTATION=+
MPASEALSSVSRSSAQSRHSDGGKQNEIKSNLTLSKEEIKEKLQYYEGTLMYERHRRKEAERDLERQEQRIVRSLDSRILRGGSSSTQEARLVGSKRTPSGAFFIGMNADYLEKPNNVASAVLEDFAHAQAKDSLKVYHEH